MTNESFLREWRVILDGSTPGPWKQGGGYAIDGLRADTIYSAETGAVITAVSFTRSRANHDARHLARCDPQTIGALIDEVLTYRGAINLHESSP